MPHLHRLTIDFHTDAPATPEPITRLLATATITLTEITTVLNYLVRKTHIVEARHQIFDVTPSQHQEPTKCQP